MGAKRNSEDPPQVSTQPSVQELQGALSLGNGKIIKQVTSGTCFSEATSGRDNSVSVSDGRGFPGLATGLCWVWLIGGCWDKLCLLISPARSSLCLYPELPSRVCRLLLEQGWALGDPGDHLPQGWGRDGGTWGEVWAGLWGALCPSFVPEMRAMKKNSSEKAENFSLESVYSANTLKQPFLLKLCFFPQSCLSTSTQKSWALPWCAGFPGQCRTHTPGSDLPFWHYIGFRCFCIGSCSKFALQTTSLSAAWHFASSCCFQFGEIHVVFFWIYRTYFYFVLGKILDSTARVCPWFCTVRLSL